MRSVNYYRMSVTTVCLRRTPGRAGKRGDRRQHIVLIGRIVVGIGMPRWPLNLIQPPGALPALRAKAKRSIRKCILAVADVASQRRQRAAATPNAWLHAEHLGDVAMTNESVANNPSRICAAAIAIDCDFRTAWRCGYLIGNS